jgi:gamma-glutamyltranspeptidase / glutathione hydrolase
LTADRYGNVVSLTATQGELFGSQVVIEGMGLVLGHGMSRFTYVPGHPNAPAPLKRPMHNMSPLIALRDGRPRFAVGMPGGPRIPNGTAQITVNLVDFGRTPAESVTAPRLQTEGAEPLSVTSNLPQSVVAGLEGMGHTLKRVDPLGGPTNALIIDPESGDVSAASEEGADCIAEL